MQWSCSGMVRPPVGNGLGIYLVDARRSTLGQQGEFGCATSVIPRERSEPRDLLARRRGRLRADGSGSRRCARDDSATPATPEPSPLAERRTSSPDETEAESSTAERRTSSPDETEAESATANRRRLCASGAILHGSDPHPQRPW